MGKPLECPEHTVRAFDRSRLEQSPSFPYRSSADCNRISTWFHMFGCVSGILTLLILRKTSPMLLHLPYSACCVSLFSVPLAPPASPVPTERYPRQDTTVQGPGSFSQHTSIFQKVAFEELPCPTHQPTFHVAPNTGDLGGEVTRCR